MIKHIVLFKIKEEHKPEVPSLIERFKEMKDKIPELTDFQIGEDFLHSARSYDVGLIATVKDKGDLAVYADHPEHTPLKQRMAAISDSVVACDFEI